MDSGETYLGSVARTASFERNTPDEESKDETLDPGADWPLGELQVSDMTVTYKYVSISTL